MQQLGSGISKGVLVMGKDQGAYQNQGHFPDLGIK